MTDENIFDEPEEIVTVKNGNMVIRSHRTERSRIMSGGPKAGAVWLCMQEPTDGTRSGSTYVSVVSPSDFTIQVVGEDVSLVMTTPDGHRLTVAFVGLTLSDLDTAVGAAWLEAVER